MDRAYLSRILSKANYKIKFLITLYPVGEGFWVWLGSDIYKSEPLPIAETWIKKWYFWPMTKKHNFIFLAALLCTACTKTADIPPANLTLSSYGPGQKNLYAVNFSSNIDLLNAFSTYEKANQLTPMLICSLEHGTDVSSARPLNIKAEGRVEATRRTKTSYGFVSDLVFYYTTPEGDQRNQNDYEAIKPLIAKQDTIPCRVRITAYGYKTYYTNTLSIPAPLMMEQMSR